MSYFHRFSSSILRCGPIPRHVAFIMDGNRRFASHRSLSRLDGHRSGYNKLIEILQWCLLIGVSHCSVFAFSIENFKREKEEVDALWELASQKFNDLLDKNTEGYRVIHSNKVKICILGDCSLLPPSLLTIITSLVSSTRHYTHATLNICMPYTSQEEIYQSALSLREAIKNNILLESDLTEELFLRNLYTTQCPPLDLLLRTSGEIRLSDFFLYQSYQFTQIFFSSPFWPEFSYFNFMEIILKYQRNHKGVEEEKKYFYSLITKGQEEEEKISLMEQIIKQRREREKEVADTWNFNFLKGSENDGGEKNEDIEKPEGEGEGEGHSPLMSMSMMKHDDKEKSSDSDDDERVSNGSGSGSEEGNGNENDNDNRVKNEETTSESEGEGEGGREGEGERDRHQDKPRRRGKGKGEIAPKVSLSLSSLSSSSSPATFSTSSLSSPFSDIDHHHHDDNDNAIDLEMEVNQLISERNQRIETFFSLKKWNAMGL